jgi:hypothetical protein
MFIDTLHKFILDPQQKDRKVIPVKEIIPPLVETVMLDIL